MTEAQPSQGLHKIASSYGAVAHIDEDEIVPDVVTLIHIDQDSLNL